VPGLNGTYLTEIFREKPIATDAYMDVGGRVVSGTTTEDTEGTEGTERDNVLFFILFFSVFSVANAIFFNGF
jgi:hypothetical protein